MFFLFLCTLNVWGGVVFFFIGSGKTQPWAELPPPKPVENDKNGHTEPEKFAQETKPSNEEYRVRF